MSWNNVIPAWALMPYRTICDSNRRLTQGFESLTEAEAHIKKYPEEDFRLLTDD